MDIFDTNQEYRAAATERTARVKPQMPDANFFDSNSEYRAAKVYNLAVEMHNTIHPKPLVAPKYDAERALGLVERSIAFGKHAILAVNILPRVHRGP